MKTNLAAIALVSDEDLVGFMEALPEDKPTEMSKLWNLIPVEILQATSRHGKTRRVYHLMEAALQRAPINGWLPCTQDKAGGGYFKTRDTGRLITWAATRERKGLGVLASLVDIRAAVARAEAEQMVTV